MKPDNYLLKLSNSDRANLAYVLKKIADGAQLVNLSEDDTEDSRVICKDLYVSFTPEEFADFKAFIDPFFVHRINE